MNEAEYRKLAEFETDYWWFVARRRLVSSLIRKYVLNLPETSSYLDVGCGCGTALDEIRQESAQSVGMDISPIALAIARSRIVTPLVAGDAWTLPFADGSFDLVTYLDVLEHVRHDLDCIEECRRVLRPGGYIVVSAPAMDFLWSEHDEALHHLRRYSRRALKAKLTAGGFRVVKMTYAVCTLCIPIFVVRFLTAFGKRRVEPETMITELWPWVNRTLIAFHDIENAVSRAVGLPFGTGLVCIARKEDDPI